MEFEDKMKRMEEINDILKNPNTSLKDSVKLFEEGMKLSKEVGKELDRIERKIEIVTTPPGEGLSNGGVDIKDFGEEQ